MAGVIPANAFADTANTMPSLPTNLKIPGLTQLTGGQQPTIGNDGRTNINLPIVPKGGVRKQFANRPAIEQSTGPTCAPFMFVGVPGTFEINRDDDPNKPIGMLSKITDPLSKALGNKFGVTMINYDADAGVNGTAYETSVAAGGKKTLATITDAAARCPKASIILGGYSQGADVAGDVATAIGNKRTPIDPARIAGVILVADPQRTPNSNVIADTSQSRPDIPAFLENAIGALSSDPSFAQLQMTATDLLGNNGKNVAGTITDLAGQLAGAVTGSPKVAGADPTQAPATTSIAPDTSSPETGVPDNGSTTPEQSVPLEPSTPKIAGSDFNGQATFSQADNTQPLPAASDALQPAKAEDADNGTLTKKIAAGVSSIGKGTEWLPISGDNGMSVAQFKSTTQEGGWVYGRTPEEKNSRRDVVDDLFVNGWDKCKDKTLADCRGNYVDGLTEDRTADGFMVPSSELTATRDKIKRADYQRPQPAILNKCLSKTSASCALAIQFQQANASNGKSVRKNAQSVPDYQSIEESEKQKVVEDIKNATGFLNETGATTPIVDIKNRNVGKIDKESTFADCKSDTGDENNRWIETAWKLSTANDWAGRDSVKEGAFSRSDTVDQFHARAGDLKLDAGQRQCLAWSIAAFNDFENLYLTRNIVYKDGYTPNRALEDGRSKDRATTIEKIYQFGGCGDGLSKGKDGAVSVPAPNGAWTLAACRSFLANVDGRTERGINFTDSDLTIIAGASEQQYKLQKPDWDAGVLASGATQGVHGYTPPLKCDTVSARACAILKTEISGPKTAPNGVTKVIKPHYPAVDDRGQIIFGDLAASEPAAPPANQSPDQVYAAGFRWATPEVVEAVKKLDEIRSAVSSRPNPGKRPDNSVNTLISPEGKSMPAIDQATINSQLGKGYVWDYTEDQKKQRGAIFGDYFRYGQCGKIGYDECGKKLLEPGAKEYLLTKELMQTAINKGKEADKQAQLGYDTSKLPADLKGCKDKSATECAGGSPATTTPNAGAQPGAPTTPAEGGGGDTTTPQSNDGAPEPTNDSPAPATTEDPTTKAAEPSSTSTTEETSTSSSTVEVAGGGDTSAPVVAGAEPGTSSVPAAPGDLATQFQNLITGPTGSPTSGSPQPSTSGTNGTKVSISPITQKAVAGGGLAGKRDADFGQLKGRVVSLCVPGDIVCSLPENSELAQDLVKFAQNISLNFPDMVGDEGSTRMAGVLALQGMNTISNITGMPQTKLSANTLQALMNIAAGGAMLAAQQPAGAALVADGVGKLPDAMPELFAQLQDVPALLRGLGSAPQTTMDKTGLSKLLARVTAAFQQAGMTSPLDVQKYPEAATAMMQALVKDNTGLVQVVTNPQYWKANAHVLYPELKISGQLGSLKWVSDWIDNLAALAKLR